MGIPARRHFQSCRHTGPKQFFCLGWVLESVPGHLVHVETSATGAFDTEASGDTSGDGRVLREHRKVSGRVPGSLAFDNASGRSLPRRSLGPLPKKFDKSPGRGELAHGDQLRCLCSLEWSLFMFAARDFEFRRKNVIRPAHAFLARGGKNMTRGKPPCPRTQRRLWKNQRTTVSQNHPHPQRERESENPARLQAPRERKPKETTRRSGALTTSQTTTAWHRVSGTPRVNLATAQILVQRAVLIDANIAL